MQYFDIFNVIYQGWARDVNFHDRYETGLLALETETFAVMTETIPR